MNPVSPEVITSAAIVAGYAAGQVAESFAVRRAAEERKPAASALGLALEQEEVTKPTTHERMRALIYRGKSPIALTTAVLLGVNAYAWSPAATAQQQVPPTLEIVVDHSGATQLAAQGEPVVTQINEVASRFEDTGITPKATVASNGTQKSVALVDVAKDIPQGYAPMEESTTQAVQRALSVAPVQESTDTTKLNAGVLVITNGNKIAKDTATEDGATYLSKLATTTFKNEKDAALKVPIFVVNVEGESDANVTEQFKKVATETGAQYWAANSDNFDNVADDVRKTITTRQQEARAKENRWPLRALGIVVIPLGLYEIFRRRGKEPFMRNKRGV